MREKILDNTYRLLEEIGRGGFGAVYRAVRLGSEGSGSVAIKLLNRNPAMNSQDYTRFQREATFMSQLLHPGIVSVYELGEDLGTYYIVMEFISGNNLREFVKIKGGHLSLPDIIDILVQASEALEYVHGHNIVHRDVKPQNILVCENRDRGEPRNLIKLVDFGVSRLSHSSLSVQENQRLENEIVGTHTYMAPEATGLVDWPFDTRADIYSLGTVAYELLAGITPFSDLRGDALLKAHVEKLPPPIQAPPGFNVPPIFEKIVLKCIAKHPNDRYQSMFGLVCDLKRMQADLRTLGRIDEFEPGTKDFGLGRIFSSAFIGREHYLEEIFKFINRDNKRTRMAWAVIKGEVGYGKSRLLNEVRNRLEQHEVRYLYLKFSESEQRLPFQALTLAINDYLAHFEKYHLGEFREYMEGVMRKLGDYSTELMHFIPALRQHIASLSPSSSIVSEPPPELMLTEVDDGSEPEEWNLDDAVPKRFAAPGSSLNQAFIELLGSLVGSDSHLVFLLDDIHLADTSTLGLFQFMIEQVNQQVNFSFVLTMREAFVRTHLIFDSFARRLASLKRRYHAWTLTPFDEPLVGEFLKTLGMVNAPPEFVTYLTKKSGGSPMQLNTLVKQMLSQDILVPHHQVHSDTEVVTRDFIVHWERLSQMVVEIVSIELLIASLDSIDERDLQLLRVAAVTHDACEFEYFKIEADFSKLEIETRLLSFVKRGLFEILGDDTSPVTRRAFSFSHEKLRNAVLLGMDIEEQRQYHFLLLNRIETLYKNPRREQILSLAKHYDGAAEKVNADAATLAFIRAFRIYVRNFQYNLARYYIDRVVQRISEIPTKIERLRRLRDVYEAEYTIYAAQGNYVSASKVCKQLIDITEDVERRKSLQTFWSQLLLSLGRHAQASQEVKKVIMSCGLQPSGKIDSVIMALNFYIEGTFLQAFFSRVLRWFYADPKGVRVVATHATTLLALGQFHGSEVSLRETFYLSARLQIPERPDSRWSAVFSALTAAMYMRRGNIVVAYKKSEEVQKYLEVNGMSDAARWVYVIKAIWLDYPMGRMERLLGMFETSQKSTLPASGLMHFETLGLKAWLRLIAPKSSVAKDFNELEYQRRRKIDRLKTGRSGKAHSAPKKRTERAAQSLAMPSGDDKEGLLDSHSARRILDAGENAQFTSLAMFSDALRYALSDKHEPLRTATEQFKRQDSRSLIGNALSAYAFSLQALVSGKQKEALHWYLRGTRILAGAKVEIVSLPISDAIRLAVLLLPLLAVSMKSSQWPWGSSLKEIMLGIDNILRQAEGIHNPRRSPVTPLYAGILAFMSGKREDSFRQLENAVKEARAQKTELIECLALSSLGGFCAQGRLTRAKELMSASLKIATENRWHLLERQIRGMARRTGMKSESNTKKADKPRDSVSLRTRQPSLALNPLIVSTHKLHEFKSRQALLEGSTKVIMDALEAHEAYAFLAERENSRSKFLTKVRLKDPSFSSSEFPETEITKALSFRLDDPVRLIRMESKQDTFEAPESIPTAATDIETPAPLGDDLVGRDDVTMLDAHTMAASTLATQSIQDKSVSRAKSDVAQKSPQDGQYLVLVAISFGATLLGWMAFPGVSSRRYVSLNLEQDLVLFGLHVGYLLNRFSENPKATKLTHGRSAESEPPPNVVSGDLPSDIILEFMGKPPKTVTNLWKVFRIKPRRVLAVHWNIRGSSRPSETNLGEIIDRHLEFFINSLRQQTEAAKLDLLMARIFTDFVAILENTTKEGMLEAFDMSVLLWDSNERLAMEGVFGTESFSFSGISEVENEIVQEISGVLAQDQLIYRERTRRVSGAGGWLFAGSSRTKEVLHRFAQHEFIENFIQTRRQGGLHLAKSLGIGNVDHPPGLALITVPADEKATFLSRKAALAK